MLEILFIALRLITLTGPDGQVIQLAPDKIATIRTPRGDDHFHKSINCLIFTTDGKNISVVETCAKVQQLLDQVK